MDNVISWNDFPQIKTNPVEPNFNSTQNVSSASFSNVDKKIQGRGNHAAFSLSCTDYVENNLSFKSQNGGCILDVNLMYMGKWVVRLKGFLAEI